MKQLLIFILIVIFSTSCTNNDDIGELNNRISILEDEMNEFTELSKQINETSNLNRELQVSITDLEDELRELSISNENITISADIELLSQDIMRLERNEAFIQQMFFGDSIFDSKSIQVGDYVASMEYVGRYETRYKFSGRKTLVGHYDISLNDEYWGTDIITFGIDESVTDVLPRANEDYRTLWFKFSNYNEAYEMLKSNGMSGEATIVIDEYEIDLLQSDVVNTARLVEVID